MLLNGPPGVRAHVTAVAMRASFHLGMPRLWSAIRRGGVQILLYHGIFAREDPADFRNVYGYGMSEQQLERHLSYVVRQCNVVSFDDLLSQRGLSRTRTNVVLTFDDGYESHYTRAFRLLESRGLPAVFAIPTGFVLAREPLWDDRIEYLVRRCRLKRVEIHWDGGRFPFELADRTDRLALYDWTMRRAAEMEQERRDAFIESVGESVQVSASSDELFREEDYRPLSLSQVREMASSELVEFASHSVKHYLLGRCEPDTVRSELRSSKAQVEGLTGPPCRTLALPGGSYDGRVLDEAFEAGYEVVLRSDFGPASGDQRLFTRRGVMRDHDDYRFADLVHGPVSTVLGAPRRMLGALRAGGG